MTRYLLTLVALLAATVMLALAAVAAGSSPADAGTAWQARSSVLLAQDATHLRPYWDGRHPAVWTSETPPMCLARFHGRHGWIRPGDKGPRWRAECLPDGPHEYAWGLPSHP